MQKLKDAKLSKGVGSEAKSGKKVLGNGAGMPPQTFQVPHTGPTQPIPSGAKGKVVAIADNPAPKHDKSYNHNTMQLKKGVMDKLSKRKVYLS